MRFAGLVIVGALCCGTANATDAGQALAQRSVCLACHQVDTKRVGPSFRDIAIRYSGNEAAAEYLARTIRDGSRGLWGAIPMPAQRHVDPATALRLANWILSLAPVSAQDGATPEPDAGESNEADAASRGDPGDSNEAESGVNGKVGPADSTQGGAS